MSKFDDLSEMGSNQESEKKEESQETGSKFGSITDDPKSDSSKSGDNPEDQEGSDHSQKAGEDDEGASQNDDDNPKKKSWSDLVDEKGALIDKGVSAATGVNPKIVKGGRKAFSKIQKMGEGGSAGGGQKDPAKTMGSAMKIVKSKLFWLVMIVFTLALVVNPTGFKKSLDCAVDSAQNAVATVEGGGDWTQKGTPAYQNAESIWNKWKTKGLSGAAISGILGNIAREGGFTIPDRAEGHFGDDEATNGVSAGVTPTGGGAGLYQFTPYTKFAPLGDKKWLDIDAQTEFLWSSEFDNAAWKTQYAHITDPEDAAYQWSELYEKPASFDATKKDAAKQAYAVFGGADIAANDSLLGNTSGNSSAGDPSSTSSDSDSSDCNSDDSSVADGTGEVPKDVQAGKGYSAKDVPDDLKKFLLPNMLSATSQGISGSAWKNPGNQCVNFTLSRMYSLYNTGVNLSGNGIDLAQSVISAGGSKIDKPKAGAIVSSAGVNQYGHTFVIEHVFADGQVLISEQNVGNLSGESAGEDSTWDVRILDKDPSKWDGAYKLAGSGMAIPKEKMTAS